MCKPTFYLYLILASMKYVTWEPTRSKCTCISFLQIFGRFAVTQDSSISEQLDAGFRYFDMRIADVLAAFNDTNFYWWHSLTGDSIYSGAHESNCR